MIRVEDLGKRYIIGHQAEGMAGHETLRDVLAEGAKSLVRRFTGRSERRPTQEEFWALKDVSFEVKRGECVGIIGRNGAGKSTLLKILSRITEPTRGRIELHGRVASLLEVGTGFHPELTGRENIYLNGAILGMTRAEIKKKFDEIVDFAEVERFLDTPVKRYSSGMYVRLAFAVAAHLEPEILVVDEVLAVGDAAFQKKCLGKMGDVATKEGRTVLFVSHQMGMISSLCHQAILLDSGKIIDNGLPSNVIVNYYSNKSGVSAAYRNFLKINRIVGDDYAQLLECYIKDTNDEITTEFSSTEEIRIGMKYKVLQWKSFNQFYPYPNCNIFGGDGTHILYTTMSNTELSSPAPGEYIAEFVIPSNLLNIGTYSVGLAFSCCDSGVKIFFYEKDALCFHIKEYFDESLESDRNGWSGSIPGVIRPRLKWVLKNVDTPEIIHA
ncbi:ABC transporter ATP-binding protein [Synechocystis salina LEGE 06155]|nr:ABC transporter ATP-binding protein [Synechocystis salina LEGE 06155]